MKKKFSEFISKNHLIGFLILMILPFIFLFAFNHPSGDDFGAEITKIDGFGAFQLSTYKYWSGKILSNALLCYNPVYFKSIIGYKVLTLIIMLLFFYTLFLLISEFTRMRLNLKERFLVTLSILFLYFYAMPSVAQNFYWITGSVVYVFSLIFIMFFLILNNRISNSDNSNSKIFQIIICSVLLIATAWSSEIAMGLMLLIIFLFVVVKLFTEKKINWQLILFALSIGLSSYIVISAPGNHARLELYPESRNLFYSTYHTLIYLIPKMLSWILYSPLLAITLLLIPVFFKMVIKTERVPAIFSINPIYSMLTSFILVFATTFVPYWSLGREPYNRNLNFVYFIFLIGWFFNVIVLVCYTNKKFNITINKIPKFLYVAAAIIIALCLVKKNNVRVAYADLLRGTAYKYDKELNERYDFIVQSKSDTCEVSNIQSIPRTLYVCDISTDPNALLNQLYAHYFNKKAIYIKYIEPGH